ncbi:MAG: phosphatidate cytidylyltransferase [Oscillospiraceae bacterium]|nr:phosphatidate cytidylyltransferase [Oscillospiraceae bacterium]
MFSITKRIITAVICVPILLVIILFLPAWCWCVVMALVSLLSAFEMMKAAGEGKIPFPVEIVALLSAVLIPVGQLTGGSQPIIIGCIMAVAAVSFGYAILTYDEDSKSGKMRLYHILVTLFSGCAIPLSLSCMVCLRDLTDGRYLVLLAMLLAFVTDGAAYFGGMYLGKHRGIVPVSPNKSIEGYISGLIGGILLSLIYGVIISLIMSETLHPFTLIICGLLGAVFAELGDLVFSLIKRQYDIKDFGNILPGHGGMLDRFDSLIFCGPVIFLITCCSKVLG